MEKERISELLLKSKDIYENGGDREDIYDVLLNTTYEMIPFSRYIPVHNEKKQEKYAKKLNMSLEEFQDKKADADSEMYSREFIGNSFMPGMITKPIVDKLSDLFDHRKSKYLCRLNRRRQRILRNNSQFIKLDLTRYGFFSNCIKLYFNIKPEKDRITNYFCDLIDFVKDEEIEVYSKSRYDDSSDMVTFRFSNIEKFDKVIEFINKHKVNNENYNPLIPTYNGIGYTIDNGESYNMFLSEKIYDYVSNTDEVSLDSFKNYINKKKQEEQLSDIDENKKDTNKLFYINLDIALGDKQFDIGKIIDSFNEVNNLERNDKEKKLIKDNR